MSVWLLLSAWVARAGVVTEPPEGATRVALVLCADEERCDEELYEATQLVALADEPIMRVDTLLAQRAALRAEADTVADRYAAALERARAAAAAGEWTTADYALTDASRVLGEWTGTPPHQALFDHAWLQGLVARGRGLDAAEAFRDAAAIAWNRTVTFPVADEPAIDAYYAQLADLVAAGTGRLVLEPLAEGATWQLDGVELGPGPLEVEVFPGPHRLTARHTQTGQAWRGEVVVQPRRVSRARARFSLAEDARWVTEALGRALDDRKVDPELAELLRGWAERYGVRTVRLVRIRLPEAAPGAPAAPPVLQWTAFDPLRRRFVDP